MDLKFAGFVSARRRAVLSAGLALSLAGAAGVAGLYAAAQSDAEASKAQDYGAAVAELLKPDPGKLVTVNGIEISKAKLDAYMVFRSTGRAFGETGPDKTPDEYVEGLIEDELLFQEAGRRGFVPTDDEVRANAAQAKAGILEVMKQDSDLGRSLRDVFEQVRGTPYAIETYDSSPQILDGFRHSMAIGMVRTAVVNELPPAERDDMAKRDARVGAFIAELKSEAKIELHQAP